MMSEKRGEGEGHRKVSLEKILIARKSIGGFFKGLTQQYVNVYIVELGFKETDVGWIRSLSFFFGTIPSTILSFLADLASRRTAYLAVLLIEALSALLYFVDGSIYVLLLADLFSILAFFALTNIENILMADYVKGKKRAFIFGLANSIVTIASTIAPIVAAYIVNMFGGISSRGIKPLFAIRFVGLLSGIALAYIFIRDVRKVKVCNVFSAIKESVEVVKLNPWLKRWILLEILGGYVFSISVPFEMIYAVRVKGADEFILGMMGFALNVGTIILSPFTGRLADRIGRIKTILLMRPLYYLSIILLLTAPSPEYLVIAWFFRGAFFATSSAFQTVSLELVPYYYRGRWSAVRSFFSMLFRSPAPYIGGLLYTMVAPETPFIAALFVDLFLRVPIIYMTPETMDRKRYLEMFREPSKKYAVGEIVE